MKKLLFSCLLAIGICANAQYTANVNFDTGDFSATNTQGFTWFGAGGLNSTAAWYCGATGRSWINQFSATNTGGGPAIDFSIYGGGQTNNGNAISVSLNYKKAANLTGTLALAYFEYVPPVPPATTGTWLFTTFGTPVTLASAAITTCTALTGTIPAGTLDPAKRYAIGTYFTRTAGNTVNLYIDDLVIIQSTTVPPNCTTFSSPTNGGTIGAGISTISWNGASGGATGYKLTVGTTAGGSNVYNGTVTGFSQSVNLLPNSTYYAKVVPTNANGDAAGCSEITFTTNSTITYCTPTPAYATVEPTTNVTFAGINNSTSATLNGTPPYEDFSGSTTQIGAVRRDGVYPISLNANTDGAFYHFFAVYVDWNQDGDFDDAGEKYFTTVPTFISVNNSNGTTGTPAAGSISVPADAKLGNTRMRVKSAFYAATGPSTEPNLSNFANACVTTGSTFGQIEDYTINVDVSLATVDTSKNNLSIYPNPFKDVLKISDVKGVKSISISDVSGRLVKTVKATAEIQVSELKTGLYIVNLHMEDGSVKSIKAIKK